MSFLTTYLWCALGIVISVILPVLWQAVRRYFPAANALGGGGVAGTLWNAIKPYVVLGIASLVTAVLIVAFLGDQLTTMKAALLAGYAWDSTLQKLK
jgi:hypothetical protein